MEIHLPPHLDGTRQLLHGSLALRPDEAAPAVPENLLRDLQNRFAATRTLVVEAPVRHRSIFRTVLNFFSTPAVGATAIIMGVLSFALPALLSPQGGHGPETFRGSHQAQGQSVPIYLSGASMEMPAILASTGDLESSSIVVIESPEAALAIEGPKVIVNFADGEVLSIDAAGRIVARDQLPEEISLLSLKIAQAASRL